MGIWVLENIPIWASSVWNPSGEFSLPPSALKLEGMGQASESRVWNICLTLIELCHCFLYKFVYQYLKFCSNKMT